HRGCCRALTGGIAGAAWAGRGKDPGGRAGPLPPPGAARMRRYGTARNPYEWFVPPSTVVYVSIRTESSQWAATLPEIRDVSVNPVAVLGPWWRRGAVVTLARPPPSRAATEPDLPSGPRRRPARRRKRPGRLLAAHVVRLALPQVAPADLRRRRR